jgi:hypothetical protein
MNHRRPGSDARSLKALCQGGEELDLNATSVFHRLSTNKARRSFCERVPIPLKRSRLLGQTRTVTYCTVGHEPGEAADHARNGEVRVSQVRVSSA